MIELLKWYLLLELIGWITFPISFRLFKNLRGKGFTFSKITGLLIWGYFYWIGNTFGIIENTRLSAIFILSLILAISLIIILKTSTREDLIHWIKDFRKAIVFWEILFFISVMFMVFMRGISPDILGTEKPMELAFINGIIRSPAFPPNDPWLSGYSISYYYFGYLIAAIVSKVIGSDAGFTFNLMIVFWFAMIAAESSAILFNLISRDNVSDEKKSSIQINQNLMVSLIAPVLLLIISNGEGLLELLHSLGVAWGENSAGEVISRFWQWLDIRELTQAPPIPFNWNIQRPGAIWWWRASRVLQDYTIAGQPREIIDEFPFFSFYLADLHPHVLSMPFVLLCINYAFNMLVSGQIWVIKSIKEIPKIFRDPSFWFSGLTFGCLIFVNTWDFPIYFGLFSLILIIKNYSTEVDVFKNIIKIIPLLGVLGAACLLLYFPFLNGLSSQAGGLVPSLVFQTRSIHLLIMFSPFAAVLFFYVAFSVFRKRKINKFLITFLAVFGAYVVLLLISLLIPLIPQTSFQQSILSIFSAKSMAELINSTIVNIMQDPFDIILLLVMITFGITAIVKAVVKRTEDPYVENISKEGVFNGILVFISASLVLFPEIFYLRDQFGWRMNTIFKFYFQAWILFSISTAYAVNKVLRLKLSVMKCIGVFIIVLSITTGAVYPIYAITERAKGFNSDDFSLNGNEYLEFSNSEETQAVEILKQAEYGIISEAVGGSYSNYGRISKLTGLPTVLGWPGHENQWRGGGEEIGSRENDIKELYSVIGWNATKEIIEKYDIKYIYIGDLERRTYQVSEEKFTVNLPELFSNASVVIYQY